MSDLDVGSAPLEDAARSIAAKTELAIRAAFDSGADFVLSVNLTAAPKELRAFDAAATYSVSYAGGPIDGAAPTPEGFIRYRRPKDWEALDRRW